MTSYWISFYFIVFFCTILLGHSTNRVNGQNILNQFLHKTRCITPKLVTSLRVPFPRHCARATQLLSKKCCSGGEPLATLWLIWPARLNFRPPATETNALPLDQLAGELNEVNDNPTQCVERFPSFVDWKEFVDLEDYVKESIRQFFPR